MGYFDLDAHLHSNRVSVSCLETVVDFRYMSVGALRMADLVTKKVLLVTVQHSVIGKHVLNSTFPNAK